MADRTGLKTVRLNLARNKEHPNGSDRYFYRFTAPLDADGHLDPVGWKKHKDQCRVVRSWAGEEEDIGHLVHHGKSWGFHYDLSGDEGDEFGYRLGSHLFVPGEYVSIRDEDGDMQTFLVVTVTDV